MSVETETPLKDTLPNVPHSLNQVDITCSICKKVIKPGDFFSILILDYFHRQSHDTADTWLNMPARIDKNLCIECALPIRDQLLTLTKPREEMKPCQHPESSSLSDSEKIKPPQ
jgi:hypothetical protein